MKKISLIVLSLLIVSMFLVGCTRENSNVSDTQIKSKLSQLSDQKLENVVKQTQVEENKNLAGQAYRKSVLIEGELFPTKKTAFIASKLLRERQQLKIEQLNKKIVKLSQSLINITNVTNQVNVTNQTGNYTNNQTGNYTNNQTGNYTNNQTWGNYTNNQTGNYTNNQTWGNYTNNQTGNYTNNQTGNYTNNQTWGNYTNQTGVGNFTNQTLGNYTNNQTGNYTNNQTWGNYTNNQTNSTY